MDIVAEKAQHSSRSPTVGLDNRQKSMQVDNKKGKKSMPMLDKIAEKQDASNVSNVDRFGRDTREPVEEMDQDLQANQQQPSFAQPDQRQPPAAFQKAESRIARTKAPSTMGSALGAKPYNQQKIESTSL